MWRLQSSVSSRNQQEREGEVRALVKRRVYFVGSSAAVNPSAQEIKAGPWRKEGRKGGREKPIFDPLSLVVGRKIVLWSPRFQTKCRIRTSHRDRQTDGQATWVATSISNLHRRKQVSSSSFKRKKNLKRSGAVGVELRIQEQPDVPRT